MTAQTTPLRVSLNDAYAGLVDGPVAILNRGLSGSFTLDMRDETFQQTSFTRYATREEALERAAAYGAAALVDETGETR